MWIKNVVKQKVGWERKRLLKVLWKVNKRSVRLKDDMRALYRKKIYLAKQSQGKVRKDKGNWKM